MQVEIEWVFNPPAAPHFGGSWERLVQIFKLSLYKVIGSRTLSDDILWTLVCEIESNMNSRPLTNVPSEINDPLPLTPNHFLLGRAPLNYPPGLFESQKVTVSRSWKSAQELASHFWNRFLREYIPNQQTRSKWNKTSENLKVNDLVWLLEDFTPRGFWPLAKVIEICPGSDGVVRSVKLRTPHGEKVRPVIKLSKVLINKWIILCSRSHEQMYTSVFNRKRYRIVSQVVSKSWCNKLHYCKVSHQMSNFCDH